MQIPSVSIRWYFSNGTFPNLYWCKLMDWRHKSKRIRTALTTKPSISSLEVLTSSSVVKPAPDPQNSRCFDILAPNNDIRWYLDTWYENSINSPRAWHFRGRRSGAGCWAFGNNLTQSSDRTHHTRNHKNGSRQMAGCLKGWRGVWMKQIRFKQYWQTQKRACLTLRWSIMFHK